MHALNGGQKGQVSDLVALIANKNRAFHALTEAELAIARRRGQPLNGLTARRDELERAYRDAQEAVRLYRFFRLQETAEPHFRRKWELPQ
jgi:hypothetical protein